MNKPVLLEKELKLDLLLPTHELLRVRRTQRENEEEQTACGGTTEREYITSTMDNWIQNKG